MAYLIHQLLRHSARRWGDRPAVIDARRGHRLTYAELDQRSDAVAAALAEAGVTGGTAVALACDKSLDAISALYGVLKCGGAYVPIDPASPPARAARIAQGCGVAHVVASNQRVADLVAPMLARMEAPGVAHILVPDAPTEDQRRAAGPHSLASWRRAGQPGGAAAGPVAGDAAIDLDIAYILHTSGSTGAPKGVALSHRNALAFVDMAADFFAVTADDVLCSHAPLHFDLSVFDLFVAAARGAAVVLLPPYFSAFPARMARAIDDHGVTVWSSVASALTLMHDRGKLASRSLASLRAVLFSGEVLPVRVLRALRQAMPGAVFYNVYGQTEANSSMYYRVDDVPEDDGARLPIGRAFPNMEVFALDRDGRVIDRPGTPGELHVRAATVAAGYVGDAARTAESFVADPRGSHFSMTGGRVYRTGDLVTLDAGGQYVFVGRTDSRIKSRGYRVELGEIEGALRACPGVEHAAAVAVADERIGHRLCAFVSPQAGHQVTRESVLATCARRLPGYMVPEHLEIRAALPRTSTGKLDRAALRAELATDTQRDNAQKEYIHE